jgi:hypothetical protein
MDMKIDDRAIKAANAALLRRGQQPDYYSETTMIDSDDDSDIVHENVSEIVKTPKQIIQETDYSSLYPKPYVQPQQKPSLWKRITGRRGGRKHKQTKKGGKPRKARKTRKTGKSKKTKKTRVQKK